MAEIDRDKEALYANREQILRAYRKQFGQMPFMTLIMDQEQIAEAYDLMEKAIKTRKPVSDSDVDRLNPMPERDRYTTIW